MEFNKIFAAVLLAGIIGMATGIVADILVSPEPLKENAFKVDTSAVAPSAPAEGGGSTAPAIPPIAPLLASADPAKGQQLSKACTACHTFEKGGPNKVGPNQWNLVGSPMGHKEDFNYSSAIKKKHEEGAHWTYEELNEFLAAPKTHLPGTTMTYAGMKSEKDRADLIAWLRTNADNPQPLPSPDAGAPVENAPAGGTAPSATTPPSSGG
ncbi:cytochrome c family protein [Inquilinus limosus]|uniref:c-type cytochrome n=1 Tax=Inquilinus limosus TaxID=171674 RepID=UPI00041CB0E1|nr:cytochrome c family protein [Inquilinus limosus]